MALQKLQHALSMIGSKDEDHANVTSGYVLKADGSGGLTWVIELATSAETATGTSTALAVTPDGLADVYQYANIYIDAGAMVSVSTNGAESGTNEYATDKAEFDFMAFDGATDERVQFKLQMPENWDRSTFKAQFYWADDGNGDSGETVAWAIKAAALTNDDPLASTAFGTAVVATADTWTAANDLLLSAQTGAVTVGGTPILHDLVMFEVYRDVSADTMDDDARLFGVTLQYKITNTVAAW